jgi:paraquat-inducible protein B
MSKQVSKTVIGGFVVSSIALFVAGVLILGGSELFKETYKFILFFEGSIKGLKVGAPIVFRGVEVGSVEKIVIWADPKTMTARIPVIVSVEPDRIEMPEEGTRNVQENIQGLIDAGLRAQLTLESMVTGQLMIDLDFHPDTPARLVGGELEYLEIPTIPTTFEQITKTLQKLPIAEIFQKLSAAVEGIENVVNSPDLKDVISSLKVTVQDTDKLVKNADKLVNNVDSHIEPLADSIRVAATDAQKLLRNVDGEVSPVAASISSAADAAAAALVQGKDTLRTIEGIVGEDSVLAHELTNALKELSSAARSVRILADYAEQHPDAMLRGKGGSGGK